jgi:hypothetical protein
MADDSPDARGIRSTDGREETVRGPGPALLVWAVVLCAFAFIVAASFLAPSDGGGHPKSRSARYGALRLAMAIEAYQALIGVLPAGGTYHAVTDAGPVCENAGLVRQLNSVMGPDSLLRLEKAELNAAGSFVDPWGRPYRVVMWKEKSADPAAARFQVYSCGPNRTWEHGEGDDIGPRW